MRSSTVSPRTLYAITGTYASAARVAHPQLKVPLRRMRGSKRRLDCRTTCMESQVCSRLKVCTTSLEVGRATGEKLVVMAVVAMAEVQGIAEVCLAQEYLQSFRRLRGLQEASLLITTAKARSLLHRHSPPTPALLQPRRRLTLRTRMLMLTVIMGTGTGTTSSLAASRTLPRKSRTNRRTAASQVVAAVHPHSLARRPRSPITVAHRIPASRLTPAKLSRRTRDKRSHRIPVDHPCRMRAKDTRRRMVLLEAGMEAGTPEDRRRMVHQVVRPRDSLVRALSSRRMVQVDLGSRMRNMGMGRVGMGEEDINTR